MAIREIVIDITTLKDDKTVMDFYRKCVRVVTGEEELNQINIMEFSEFQKFNLPVNVEDFCYYVKFVKGNEFITFLIDSGTLYLEGFRIMEGKFYLLGNEGLVRYKKALIEMIRADAGLLPTQIEMIKADAGLLPTQALIEMIRTDAGLLPTQPRILTSLQYYGFSYHNLGISSSYPKLEDAAGKHQSEIDIGIKSLNSVFDRLMNFNEDDKQTAGECGLFGVLFLTESFRSHKQALHVAGFFRDKTESRLTKEHCMHHLA